LLMPLWPEKSIKSFKWPPFGGLIPRPAVTGR
jgi:hypothetical protein